MKLFQVTEGNMQQSDWAIKKITVIIRMMQDDEAVVTMVDSNLQREQITPSEKAYAYKMKYDAIKKKAGRKNCGQVDHNTGKRSIDVIGELCGDSAKAGPLMKICEPLEIVKKLAPFKVLIFIMIFT